MKQRLLVEEWIVGVLLCGIVVMVMAQVMSRYLLHTSLSYTEELVRYGFVWATFFGASAAVRRRRHLSITGVLHFLPEKVVIWVKGLSVFAGILFFSTLTVTGIMIAALQYRTGQTTAALGLPMWFFGCVVPICAFLAGIRLVSVARHMLGGR